MRPIIVLLVALSVTGCGASHDKGLRTCNGNRIVPAEVALTKSGATFSIYVPAQPCGRVFERNALAAIEAQLGERVTGIDCSQIGDSASCFARVELSGCIDAEIQNGRSTQIQVSALPEKFRGLADWFCDEGLP